MRRYRVSALVRTAAFTLVVPGTVAGLLPWLIAMGNQASAPPGLDLRSTGWLIAGVGLTVYAWSAVEFSLTGRGTPNPLDPPRAFVATGPYHYVRNPMYLGVATVVAGEVVLTLAPALALYLLVVAAAFHAFLVVGEEPGLRRRFGNQCEEVRPQGAPLVAAATLTGDRLARPRPNPRRRVGFAVARA